MPWLRSADIAKNSKRSWDALQAVHSEAILLPIACLKHLSSARKLLHQAVYHLSLACDLRRNVQRPGDKHSLASATGIGDDERRVESLAA